MTAALETFDEAEHGTFLRDDFMTGVLAEGFEDVGEAGVFEVLRDHGEAEVAKAPDEADELEVAKVGGDPDGTGLAGLLLGGGVVHLDLHVGLPVLGGEAAGPKQIEEGAGEVLIGSEGDAAALCGCVELAKSGLQVLQSV